MTIGGRVTVTVKPQFVEVPQASLAVQLMGVVPMGKVVPLGGLQVSVVGGLQPPDAELLKNTTASLELVAEFVTLGEHVKTIGGRVTAIVKLQLVVVPQESLAVQM